MNPALWVLIIFASLASCQAKVEGCLNADALNFELNADKPCRNCCRYPPVSLTLTQRWNAANFITSDTFLDINMIPFRIIDIRYMLSSFSWRDHANGIFTIDSSDISCGSNSVRYTPDLLVIEPGRFDYPIDSVRRFPIIESLSFKAGWPAELECVDAQAGEIPKVFGTMNPLYDNITGTRSAIRVILQRDLNDPALDTIRVNTCQEIFTVYHYAFIPGSPVRFQITVDYAKWFEEANTNDINSFQTSILNHLAGSFSRTP